MKLLNYTLLVLISIAMSSCGDAKKNDTIATNNNAAEENAVTDPLVKSVTRGKAIYRELCVTCHLTNGKGVAGAFPPLNPSDWLTGKRAASIHAIKYGLKGPIEVNGKPYDNIMLPLGLDDQEIADVMNYTIQTWNSGEIVTLDEVKAVKK